VIEIEIDERDRDILTDVVLKIYFLKILLNQYLSPFKIVSFMRIIFLQIVLENNMLEKLLQIR